jgi:hypothetical protein
MGQISVYHTGRMMQRESFIKILQMEAADCEPVPSPRFLHYSLSYFDFIAAATFKAVIGSPLLT